MSSTSASVYSLADEHRARAESDAWTRFIDAGDGAEFCAGWLALLAARIERARAALLLIAESEGAPYSVVAAWPDPRRDLQYLGLVAQRALTERVGIVTGSDGNAPDADGPAQVGYPIEVAGRLVGAVVFDIGAGAPGGLQPVLRQIHWASAWLHDYFGRHQLVACEAELTRVTLLDELMASALQHRRLQASALAVANELATRLRCERVSIGFANHAEIELLAMSHAANFERRSNLVRAICDAMDEVLDFGVAMVVPVVPVATDEDLGAMTHAETARILEVQALMSVPIAHDSHTIGAITFERRDGPPFDASEQRIACALGLMLAPVWSLQRAQERPWWRHARDALRVFLLGILGPRYPGLKLAAVLGALLLLSVAMIHTEYRVGARTVIEGSTQLAIAAPFDGFIAESLVRAGDTVRTGQPLARLDERDLLLERSRWRAERDQLQRKYQVAMVQGDLSAMGVIGAQINQSEAQLALAQDKAYARDLGGAL